MVYNVAIWSTLLECIQCEEVQRFYLYASIVLFTSQKFTVCVLIDKTLTNIVCHFVKPTSKAKQFNLKD